MSASLETPNLVSAVVDATDSYSGSLTEVQEFTVTLAQGAGTTSVDWGAIGGDLEDQEDLQEALDAKQDELTFDSTPTSGSTNPVTSGGLYTVLSGKQQTIVNDSTSYSDPFGDYSTGYDVQIHYVT